MVAQVKPLTQEGVLEIAPNLRAADLREYHAMMDEPIAEGLERLRAMSRKSFAVVADGRVVCAFGVLAKTALSTEGHPWLVATPEIESSPRLRRWFVKQSKPWASEAMSGFRRCSNFCDVENRMVVRWLQWLGFTFDARIYERRGVEFRYFSMEI